MNHNRISAFSVFKELPFVKELPLELRKNIFLFAVFSPSSREELLQAIDEYVEQKYGDGETETQKIYPPMGEWDATKVTDLSQLFWTNRSEVMWKYHSVFNEDLSNWNVSNATNLRAMFDGCAQFTSELSNWDVSSATNLSFMFSGCTKFTSDLSNWDISRGTFVYAMFGGCRSFDRSCTLEWPISQEDRDRLFIQLE